MSEFTLAQWLELQWGLQVEAFQVDPGRLDGEALADYVTWNALALENELHEFLAEVQWKPWANRRGEVRDHGRALEEFVDVMHFLGNLALALRFDPDDIEHIYRAKVEVNKLRQLQEGGYDAIEAKCPHCKRDLVAVGRVSETLNLDGITVTVEQCGACGWELARVVR